MQRFSRLLAILIIAAGLTQPALAEEKKRV